MQAMPQEHRFVILNGSTGEMCPTLGRHATRAQAEAVAGWWAMRSGIWLVAAEERGSTYVY